MDAIVQDVAVFIVTYGLQVLGAVLILVIGWLAAKVLRSTVEKLMARSQVDETLVRFVARLVHVAVWVFVLIAALSRLGVQTASFIAVVGAAGLAVGLALQGSLANFAAGVLLILFKPCKAGDYVEAAGVTGTIEEVGIFTTRLRSPDNKAIIVPNAKLTGENITNYTAKKTRRVDLVVGVAYDADLKHAREVFANALARDDRILEDPVPQIAVLELADSSVNFAVRPWVKTEDYWDVYFDTTEAIKVALDEAGIGIPFPQHDVHLFQETAA
ncbi:MAG: mechanosensitive ion channel family protein [bacterium]